ncbi:MAG: ribosomal biogenesis protein [Euryarchaeota archaeon]|nr:ribosomal biogenesis protein [Euryarchaeota archaeon]
MYILTKWFGIFLIDDGGKVADKHLFPEDPDAIAKRLALVREGEILNEERELAGTVSGVEVTERRLFDLGVITEQKPPELKPEDFGFDTSVLRTAMLRMAKAEVGKAHGPDAYIMQAVAAYEDLTRHMNESLERLKEWHGIYFPELPALVSDERYLEAISEGGTREDLADRLGVSPSSSGAECGETDLYAPKAMAMYATGASHAKGILEAYIRQRMTEVAPNISTVAGELLGAKLIALSGGLQRMARLPSSTVQVLGAEKAFFRHIKEGAKPPKHGILFQHPQVHRSPYWLRGKVARLLANKLVLAARADFYTHRYIGKDLIEGVKAGVARIYEQGKEPPAKKRGEFGPKERGGRRHEGRRQGGRFQGKREFRGKRHYGRQGGGGRPQSKGRKWRR